MAAKYWIKLYHEILHDRKMATLDNQTWRRVIECFLFAGEVDKGGYLPKLADMAWELHATEEELETDLNELVKIGILEYRDGLYFVRKFEERQKPMDKAEYMRRKRDDKQLQNYYQPSYQPVTNGNVDKNRIDKIREEETEPPPFVLTPVGILNKASGLAAFPGKQPQYIGIVEAMRDTFGAERTIEAMKHQYKIWCSKKRKEDGGNYSAINLTWIDWAQEELAATPVDYTGEVDTSKMNQQELEAYYRVKYADELEGE